VVRRFPLLVALALAIASIEPDPAAAGGAAPRTATTKRPRNPSWVRSERGLARDRTRVRPNRRIAALERRLRRHALFRPIRGGRGLFAGPGATIDVPLGGGLRLVARVGGDRSRLRDEPELPAGAAPRRLVELALVKGGVRRSLLPSIPVYVHDSTADDHGDNFIVGGKHIVWEGPTNKFALWMLLHEIGHLDTLATLTAKERRWVDLTSTAGRRGIRGRALVGSERIAWASALRALRALQADGLDPFADVPLALLEDATHACLAPYVDAAPPTAGSSPPRRRRTR
jgi:hypothetical protein